MTSTAGGAATAAIWVCGLQQLALDALWYIDPDAGVNGVWDNALAAEKPIYNADYTQMTVKLRQGLYWSDGVEFTADDLYYTVDVQYEDQRTVQLMACSRAISTSWNNPTNIPLSST